MTSSTSLTFFANYFSPDDQIPTVKEDNTLGITEKAKTIAQSIFTKKIGDTTEKNVLQCLRNASDHADNAVRILESNTLSRDVPHTIEFEGETISFPVPQAREWSILHSGSTLHRNEIRSVTHKIQSYFRKNPPTSELQALDRERTLLKMNLILTQLDRVVKESSPLEVQKKLDFLRTKDA
jgi:hypothetical protein